MEFAPNVNRPRSQNTPNSVVFSSYRERKLSYYLSRCSLKDRNIPLDRNVSYGGHGDVGEGLNGGGGEGLAEEDWLGSGGKSGSILSGNRHYDLSLGVFKPSSLINEVLWGARNAGYNSLSLSNRHGNNRCSRRDNHRRLNKPILSLDHSQKR